LDVLSLLKHKFFGQSLRKSVWLKNYSKRNSKICSKLVELQKVVEADEMIHAEVSEDI